MSYLETLRRIPNDIVLAIFAQDFEEANGTTCVCGWAYREALARVLQCEPDSRRTENAAIQSDVPRACCAIFGGSLEEWQSLYGGAEFHVSAVEEAVVDRLNEIVSV